MTTTLQFEAPDDNAPGFLLRIKKQLEFKAMVDSGDMKPELIDKMVDFLADFCVNVTKEEATELLWQVSKVEYMAMLNALGDGDADNSTDNPLPEKGDS